MMMMNNWQAFATINSIDSSAFSMLAIACYSIAALDVEFELRQ